MKSVPIKVLKQELARWTEIASKGETVEITRHNKPFARLGPAWGPEVHIGRHLGRGGLRPAVDKGTNGIALKALMEDREGR